MKTSPLWMQPHVRQVVAWAASLDPRQRRPASEPEPIDRSLLSRISLAPPPRGGRSPAEYVYAPEPEAAAPRAAGGPGEPHELGERFYEVHETVAGRGVVRHSSASLFGATDYAFELHEARGVDVEVVRVRGVARDSVLRFGREHAAEAADPTTSPLDVFGHPVTRRQPPP